MGGAGACCIEPHTILPVNSGFCLALSDGDLACTLRMAANLKQAKSVSNHIVVGSSAITVGSSATCSLSRIYQLACEILRQPG